MPHVRYPSHEEFLSHVVVDEDGCWLWEGNATKYGKMLLDDQLVLAHRLAWEIFEGPFPAPEGDEGYQRITVCHSCDKPGCVRPKCLFLGTAADNSHDMSAKGRGRNQKAPNPRWSVPA